MKRDEKQTQLDEGVVVFESKSIRSLRHGYGGRRRAVDSNRDSKSLRAVRRPVRTLKECEAQIATCKRSAILVLAEQEKVKLLFPNKRSLEKALPHRTWIAIRSRAGLLGLRKKQHRWLASDLSKLRRMWSEGATQHELCEALPRYSWNQIVWQARGPKFLRPKKPPVNSGHPVINQIKERARYLNLSMGDVDATAGTKKYFYAAQWVSAGRPNLKAVGKAILALDGEVAAIWH